MVFSTKDIAVVGGIGVLAYLLIKGGKDLFNALPSLDAGLRESIGDIKSEVGNFAKEQQENFDSFVNEQGTNFDNFVIDSQTNLDNTGKGITDFFSGLFNQSQAAQDAQNAIFQSQLDQKAQDATDAGFDSVDAFEKATDPNNNPDLFNPNWGSGFTGKEEDRADFEAGLIDQFGRVIDTIKEVIPDTMTPISNTISNLLPSAENEFKGGGVSFIGGTIRENPVDTLSEVLNIFPQLSASQAADFLNEHSGILPSQIDRIDPDIKNIVANVGGENIAVNNIGISNLLEEEMKAKKLTCSLFGLNCEGLA
jgi:hypothetical protein